MKLGRSYRIIILVAALALLVIASRSCDTLAEENAASVGIAWAEGATR